MTDSDQPVIDADQMGPPPPAQPPTREPPPTCPACGGQTDSDGLAHRNVDYSLQDADGAWWCGSCAMDALRAMRAARAMFAQLDAREGAPPDAWSLLADLRAVVVLDAAPA